MDILTQITKRLEKCEKALEKVDDKDCLHTPNCTCAKCVYFREFPFSITKVNSNQESLKAQR